MPMMRRGPLARYNAEWVLRQASASDTSGSIEFHTDEPLTLFFRSGRVCHAAHGVAADGPISDVEAAPPDETTARALVLDLVTAAMRATDGWYYLDPIGHQVVTAPWDWDVAALILDARIRRRATDNRAAPAAPAPVVEGAAPPVASSAPPILPSEAATAAASVPLAERRVELAAPAGEDRITLTSEAWRVACALATPQESAQLRDDLGWSGPRFDAALSELEAAGVLATAPSRVNPSARPAAPQSTEVPVREPVAAPLPTPAVPAATAPDGARPLPNVPPQPGSRPKPTVDRRSALRRLISNLKPA